MSEEGASTYEELIAEAYLRPIRSVVVVDDDFPTLDGMLSRELDPANPPFEPKDVKAVRDIIHFCHENERRWMVEVHDGLPDNESTTSHFTQADLMILDFHLDRDHPSDPTKAINILRRLDDNDYFNLVIVYTKGVEEVGGDFARVVQEIAIGLCTEDERLVYEGRGLEKTVLDLEEWETEDEDIRRKILDAVDDGTFLRIRTSPPGDIEWTEFLNCPRCRSLRDSLTGHQRL